MPYTQDETTGMYTFHDADGKQIHTSNSIAIVNDSSKGGIIKHGPTAQINQWANQLRNQAMTSGAPLTVNVIESEEWDLKSLNKMIKNSSL